MMKEEFLSTVKSTRTIIIISIFVLFSYSMSKYIIGVSASVTSGMSAAYSSIRLLVFLMGYLFVSILSHSTLNKEIETGSIKFVASKISRNQIILGKLAGIFLFWLICLTSSFVVISLMTRQLDISALIVLLITIFYYISVCVCVSQL